ncbi:MAG: hypothetical protein NTX79_01425 [Candidatus Micrarchaeota archaeon]|nr:hypothetical protein [Candidatus Micrarchaeota archaeon]
MVFLYQGLAQKQKTVPKEKTYAFDALTVIMSYDDKQKFNGPKLKNGKLLGEVVNDFLKKNEITLRRATELTESQRKLLKAEVGGSIFKVYIEPHIVEIKPK